MLAARDAVCMRAFAPCLSRVLSGHTRQTGTLRLTPPHIHRRANRPRVRDGLSHTGCRTLPTDAQPRNTHGTQARPRRVRACVVPRLRPRRSCRATPHVRATHTHTRVVWPSAVCTSRAPPLGHTCPRGPAHPCPLPPRPRARPAPPPPAVRPCAIPQAHAALTRHSRGTHADAADRRRRRRLGLPLARAALSAEGLQVVPPIRILSARHERGRRPLERPRRRRRRRRGW